jgi:signal transduction histidine kinase
MDIPIMTRKEQEEPAQGLGLKLFVAGKERPESARAVARFREMLQDYDLHASSVQVVDIEQSPQAAKEAQVIGTPALVREYPPPRKSVIGELSDATVALRALDLPITKKRYAASVAESPQEPLILREAGRAELKTVRVLMIDFNPVVRESLRAILAMDYGIELIPDAADADQALLQLKQASDQGRPIHIVLTETRTSTLDGIQATRLIKEQFPEVAVLVLTENLNDSYVIDAIHAGAGGYIFLKDMAPEELLQGIQRVVMGGMQMKRELLHTAVENLIQNDQKTLAERTTDAAHLTKREVEVLRLLGHGDSNNAISETLGITLDTTNKHVRNVIDKLQERTADLEKTAKDLEKEVSIRQQAEEELRELSHSLAKIQDDERNAVARELHDDVGQMLIYLTMLIRKTKQAPIDTNFEELTTTTRGAIQTIRGLCSRLIPLKLETLTLKVALDSLFEQYTKLSQIHVEFSCPDELHDLSSEIKLAAYRIIQEALTNVARHAKASEVKVRLSRKPDRLRLEVKDNGTGFNPKEKKHSTGLTGMRERALVLDGKLTIESNHGQGTRVVAELPLPETEKV